MTTLDIDPNSDLTNYILFALNTRARRDVISRWGNNTKLNFDALSNSVDVYLMVSGVRQSMPEDSASFLSKLLDIHYNNVSIRDRLACVVFDIRFSKYPGKWLSSVLDSIRMNIGIKHRVVDGMVLVELNRVRDYVETYSRINYALNKTIERMWMTGFVKTNDTKLIEDWDLIRNNKGMYVPNWVEPRISFSLSKLLLDIERANNSRRKNKDFKPGTDVIFRVGNNLVTRHNIASWSSQLLEREVLFTEGYVTVSIETVEQFHAFVNYMYLDEGKSSGKVNTFKAYTLKLNDDNEVVYRTTEGYILSILEE